MMTGRFIASAVLISLFTAGNLEAAEISQAEAFRHHVNNDGSRTSSFQAADAPLRPKPRYYPSNRDAPLMGDVYPVRTFRQSNSKGQKGQKGPSGDKGDIGAVGTSGPVGLTGPVGNAGAAGPKGLPGGNGLAGPTGPSGPPGPAGSNGEPGFGFAPVECPESSDSDSVCFTAATVAGYRCFCVSTSSMSTQDEAESWCQSKMIGSNPMTLVSFKSQLDLTAVTLALDSLRGGYGYFNDNQFWTSAKLDTDTNVGSWSDGTAIDPILYCTWKPRGFQTMTAFIALYYACVDDLQSGGETYPAICMA